MEGNTNVYYSMSERSGMSIYSFGAIVWFACYVFLNPVIPAWVHAAAIFPGTRDHSGVAGWSFPLGTQPGWAPSGPIK